MAKIEKFEDIQAWQKARELNVAIYQIAKNERFSKDYLSIRISNLSSLPIMMNKSQEEICLKTLESKRKMQLVEVLNNCEPISINYSGTFCKTRLKSKTGFNIIEEIFIFKKNDEIRSLTLCYEESIDENKLDLLIEIFCSPTQYITYDIF